jgi:acid phosphatase
MEALPSAGYTGCTSGSLYARKHCPWTDFSNLNHANERPFEEFAAAESLGTLPNLAFVIPDMCDDAHDCPLASGDAWLAAHVPGMLRAVGYNGVVIVTFDEDDRSESNKILTTFNGALVTPGHVSQQPATHYTLLRTLCEALGLSPIGAAAAETPFADIWTTRPVQVQQITWAAAKGLYR